VTVLLERAVLLCICRLKHSRDEGLSEVLIPTWMSVIYRL
jgi:hypothetical protein